MLLCQARIRNLARGLAPNLILVGFSLTLSFAVAELVSRLFFPDTDLRYVDDPEALYYFEPNQVGTFTLANGFSSPPARINRFGFRGADVDARSPRRILILGDSFTFGTGVSDEETFSARLGHAFDGQVAVVNGGQGGYGVFQMAATLRRVGEELHPNLVIVVLWQGDFLRQPPDPTEAEQFFRRRHILRLIKSSVFLTHIGRRLDRLLLHFDVRAAVPPVGQTAKPPSSDPKSIVEAHLRGLAADAPRLQEMHQQAQCYGQGILLVLWPKEGFASVAEEGLANRLTEALAVFAGEHGIPFTSLQPTLQRMPSRLLLIPNDWHPTPLAHCLAAQHIGSELTRLGFPIVRPIPCDILEAPSKQSAG